MHLLALLHRWAGGLAGVLFVVIGLSGALLVWESAWIGLPHAGDPLRPDVQAMAHAVEVAASGPGVLSRITFAGDGIGLHQAIYANRTGSGGGAYLAQSGEVVSRWSSEWQRPELWLFDLHHHLFAGEAGETLTGIIGLLGLFFVVSGAVLWWRTRRTFVFRLWPARLTRSAIVRQHRDLGIVAAPLLIVSFVTGAAMIFPAATNGILSPFAAPAPAQPAVTVDLQSNRPDFTAMLDAARRQFPNAAIRRLQFPSSPDSPFVLRVRQPAEWTPNGRTFLRFDARGRLLATEDALSAPTASRIVEKFYPIHSARVGGIAWKMAMTASGVALALLGSLAVFSFWLRTPQRPVREPAARLSRMKPN